MINGEGNGRIFFEKKGIENVATFHPFGEKDDCYL
jgi:hypothetical protein